MSLNGLDDAKVKEAHELASTEAGGWFLLKYASRDEVELLGRGGGGIVEMRDAITAYEEVSPLFGFLRYRRKNVIIKYVPEDCSRLIQARVTVHYNAILDHFTPHDTTFSIATAKELRDSSLSTACSLHTTSGSTASSTSSIKKRMLLEIAEDEEEEQGKAADAGTKAATDQSSPEVSRPPTATSTVAPDAGLPELDNPLKRVRTSASDMRPMSPTSSIIERRMSSQTTRTDFYSYKPKVKLGPRPSVDAAGRPQTAGGSYFRPISTLPAGMKLFSKNARRERENRLSINPLASVDMLVAPPAIPESSDGLDQGKMPPRPHTSSGSSINQASLQRPPKSPGITPEKARLMRALELRKKQMSVAPPPDAPPTDAPPTDTPPEVKESAAGGIVTPMIKVAELSDAEAPVSLSSATTVSAIEQDNEIAVSTVEPDNKTAEITSPEAEPELGGSAESEPATADDTSDAKCDTSSATRSDSTPPSPNGQSEKAESTVASSVTEASDETPKGTVDVESDIPGSIKDNALDAPPPTSADHESDQASSNAQMTKLAQPEDQIVEERTSDNDISIVEALAVEEVPTATAADGEPEQISPIERTRTEAAEPQPLDTAETKDDLSSSIVMAEDLPAGDDSSVSQDTATVTTTTAVEAKIDATPVDAASPVAEPAAEQSSDKNTPSIASATEALETISAQDSANRDNRQDGQTDDAWRIPRSKFSVPNLKAMVQEAPAVPDVPASDAIPLKSAAESILSTDSRQSEDELQRSISQRKRPQVDRIHTNMSGTDISSVNSDALISDDDLMDELQSATVQEAQPILVPKSPSSSLSSSQTAQTSNPHRVFSNPLRKDESAAESQRSVSASAYLQRINQQPSGIAMMAKKVNIGSGNISQRIKAFEKLSTTSVPVSAGATSAPSTTFFSVSKSTRGPSRTPSIMERTNSLKQRVPSPSPSFSGDSSPDHSRLRDRPNSSALSLADTSTSRSRPETPRGESISVTAKIVRNPKQPFAPTTNVTDSTPLQLESSPLVIDHQKSQTPHASPPPPTAETVKERRTSTASNSSHNRRSSMTVIRDYVNEKRQSLELFRSSSREKSAPKSERVRSPTRPPSTHWSPRLGRPLSIRSNSNTSFDQPVPLSTSSSGGSSEEKTEKKSGLSSRLLRRMSSSLTTGRKGVSNTATGPVREEAEHSTAPALKAPATTSGSDVVLGDVNVQFPDTLLWKRRAMKVDAGGFLLLAPGQGALKTTTDNLRRFHLSDFRPPYIPDLDAQELPNSVVLDFNEGSQLQLACEDRAGQQSVLKGLQDAYKNWVM